MMRTSLLAIAVALTALAQGSAHAQAPAETIAITGATVHVAPGKTLEDATVIIRNGTISQVGKGVAVPAGARVVDGKGKVVTAGFIEAASRLGLVEVNLEGSTREGSFGNSSGNDAVQAAYRVSDGYNPRSVAIPVARAHGVTSAIAVPTGGLIAGMSAWLSLADGTLDQVIVQSPLAMHAQLGEAALGSASGSRGLALLRVRELITDALAYSRQKAAYERNQARSFAAARLHLEALLPVAQGRMPLVVEVHRAADISAAIRMARELGLRLIIQGGTEAWMLADELRAARVGVLISPADNLPESFERVHVRDDAPGILADAGVDVVISTLNSYTDVRTLRQLAGMAVANGMRWEQALAAVTTAPAKLFGVPRGTLEQGAVADVVVWSGDPFELGTRAEHVFIAGKEASLRTRQTLLLERYRRMGK